MNCNDRARFLEQQDGVSAEENAAAYKAFAKVLGKGDNWDAWFNWMQAKIRNVVLNNMNQRGLDYMIENSARDILNGIFEMYYEEDEL